MFESQVSEFPFGVGAGRTGKEDDAYPSRRAIPTVLLIEDDLDQRFLFAQILLQGSFNVISVESAEEAFEQLETRSADCIVCDVVMPGMGGQGFVQMVRRRPGFETIPILVMTSSRGDLEAPVLSGGADVFCLKRDAWKTICLQLQLMLR